MFKIPKQTPARRRNIAADTYNPDTRELDVTFSQGKTYRYHDVSPEQAAAFTDDPSPGGFLHEHIIGKHDHTILDEEK